MTFHCIVSGGHDITIDQSVTRVVMSTLCNALQGVYLQIRDSHKYLPPLPDVHSCTRALQHALKHPLILADTRSSQPPKSPGRFLKRRVCKGPVSRVLLDLLFPFYSPLLSLEVHRQTQRLETCTTFLMIFVIAVLHLKLT